MKLCPQCDFIYEDDQSVCDMDGKKLVLCPAPVVNAQSVAPPTRLTINIPARSRSRRFPVLIIGGVALVALLSVGYFARTHEARPGSANPFSNQPTTVPTTTPTPNRVSVSTEDFAEAPLTELPPEQSAEQAAAASSELASPGSSSLSPSSEAALRRASLGSSPVSAGGSTGRGAVIVRLRNGAVIKADEVWERKEGYWYRQAGMVTFLKRSTVRGIEPLASPTPRTKPGALSAEDRKQKSESLTAQNRLRLNKLEDANAKKESRVGSFLKKTGRILKKPFKF